MGRRWQTPALGEVIPDVILARGDRIGGQVCIERVWGPWDLRFCVTCWTTLHIRGVFFLGHDQFVLSVDLPQ